MKYENDTQVPYNTQFFGKASHLIKAS